MAVMTGPRTDDRIDALVGQVAALGVRMDERFARMDECFDQVDRCFERVGREQLEQRREMKAGFERADDRFERVQGTLLALAAFERTQPSKGKSPAPRVLVGEVHERLQPRWRSGRLRNV
jgi:hypothetical protein